MDSWRAELVERVALAMVQEIGWGTFSHFDPNDMRRVSTAALSIAIPAVLERAAEVAEGHVGQMKRHRIAAGWKMERYQPWERDEIAARESQGNITAKSIATAIRSLKDNPDVEA